MSLVFSYLLTIAFLGATKNRFLVLYWAISMYEKMSKEKFPKLFVAFLLKNLSEYSLETIKYYLEDRMSSLSETGLVDLSETGLVDLRLRWFARRICEYELVDDYFMKWYKPLITDLLKLDIF